MFVVTRGLAQITQNWKGSRKALEGCLRQILQENGQSEPLSNLPHLTSQLMSNTTGLVTIITPSADPCRFAVSAVQVEVHRYSKSGFAVSRLKPSVARTSELVLFLPCWMLQTPCIQTMDKASFPVPSQNIGVPLTA